MRICSRCGEPNPRPTQRYCGPCHADYMREWRLTHPPTAEQREKNRVRCTANNALKRGEIERGPCETCGLPGEEMHHDDYARPLAVRWFCRPHHVALHYAH